MKLKKPKMNSVKISDKDKKLLYIVGIIAVVFLGYRFFISPKIQDIKITKGEYGVVKNKRDTLKSEYENIDSLRKKTDDIKYNEQRMQLRIPAFESVPHSLKLLFENADRNKVVVSTVACEGTSHMTAAEYIAAGGGGDSLNKKTGNKYVAKNSFNVSASGDFEQLYSFIKSIEESERKFSVDNLSLKESKVGILSATLKITALNYVDKGNPIQCPYEIPEFSGRTNIFTVTPSVSDTSENTIYYTPEYYMNINYTGYAGPKVVFMENGKFDTELCYDSDKEIEGKLTVEEYGNNLKAICKLGNKSKVISSKLDLKGDSIRMTVLSTPRVSSEDIVKLIMSVDNKTKHNLEITVVNDDQFNPKFNLKEPKDNVIVKGVNR